MKITVKDCLRLDAFSKCVLAAGKRNLENRVRTISVMDATTVEDAVKFNGVREQLVLTSFFGMNNNPTKQTNTDGRRASVCAKKAIATAPLSRHPAAQKIANA